MDVCTDQALVAASRLISLRERYSIATLHWERNSNLVLMPLLDVADELLPLSQFTSDELEDQEQ